MIPFEDSELEEIVAALSARAGVSAETYVREAVEDRLEDDYFGPLVKKRVASDRGDRFTSAQIRRDLELDL